MTKIITISNRKGGTGKTTTCVTLGHGLALKGKQILPVDVDPQGHVSLALGLEQSPGLFDLLVAGTSLRNVTRQARSNLWLVPGNPRTSTAKTVKVRKVVQITSEDGFLCGHTVPVPGQFIGPEMRKLVKIADWSDNKPYLSFDYGWCELWNDKASSCSWYA